MRNFSKKLAFVLAAAMVFTAFAPAAKADAAEKMVMNRASQTLYVNEGVNDKGAETLPEGLYGNVQEYDFYVKNKPANYAKELKFAWESSDEKVATVDNKGLTKAVAVGTATITCTITDKATGDEVAEATAKVTVKANAADVVITNAEDYDNLPVPEDGVVDLNRAMYDENDTKTTKRGKVVTDYTRWIAEDADGEAVDATVVAIDQATGKFTFAADAPAGDYALYCQTYQSDKYNQTTAESEKVTVTVVETKKVFEVDQTASNKFDLLFEDATDVAIADVTVNKIIKVGNSTGKIPQVVSGVAASQDKKSASVSLFTNFQDGANYEISVKGFDDVVTMTAIVGAPETMTVSSDSGIQGGAFVTIKTNANLTYTLYDAAGNDVTNTATGTVTFRPAVTSTSDYYVAGKTIYIYKEGIEVTVNAEYNTGKYENGKPVGNVQGVGYFVGVAPTPITVAEIAFAVKNGGGSAYANNEVPLSDGYANLELKIKTTAANDKLNTYGNGAPVGLIGENVTVSYRTSNPDVLAIVGNSIRVFKEGTSAILVDLVTAPTVGEPVRSTIAAYYVTVVPNRTTTTVEVGSNGQLIVGTDPDFCKEKISVTAKDQYGARVNVSAVTDVKFADGTPVPTEAYKFYPNDDGWQDRIEFYGQALANKIETNANEAYLYMTAKVKAGNATKDINFVVVVKKPIDGLTYLSAEVGGNNSGNVGMFDTPYDGNKNTENAKAVAFKVFEMSNGVKTAQLPVNKKLATTSASGSAYGSLYYTVDRDGVDVTQYTYFDGKTVKLDYNKYEAVKTAQMAVTGSAVIYRTSDWSANFGGGTYTFTLYKVIKDGLGNQAFAYESAVSCSVNVDTGSYSLVKRTSEYAKYTDKGVEYKLKSDESLDSDYNQTVLRNCFAINGRDGQNATVDVYKVNVKDADGYVFVESITFYESLQYKVDKDVNDNGVIDDNEKGNQLITINENVYAPYTVYINVSLKK